MQIKVLDHGTLGEMVMYGDVNPLLTAFPALFLRPLNFDFTAIPGEDEQNAGHFEFERIVLLDLHTKNLSLA